MGFDSFVDQSFTVQSKEEVRKKWEKSICVWTGWQSIPVNGPWCPSYISQIPALDPCLDAPYTVPSSLPTMKLLKSLAGKETQVTATGRDCFCWLSSIVSCGWDNMSNDHEHNLPSVEMVIRLWAFWLPTTWIQYIGWVCAPAVNGLRWTGVFLWLRLSQSTSCPE